MERFLPEGSHLKRLIEQHSLVPEETILRHRNGRSIKVLLSGSRLERESSAMVISAQRIRELGTTLAA
jgi:hypothetical protein